MGVFINLAIVPSRISKEAWREAYADAMQISKAGQLAVDGHSDREGSRFLVMLPAPTYEQNWACRGDLITGLNMENFYLPMELPEDDEEDNGADVLACYVNEEDFEPPKPPLWLLWGSKTQGRRAHIWLLAMALAIHDHFPEAVFLSGDINAGQCIRACGIVKEVLGRDVQLPIQYRYDVLLEHIRRMGIQDPLQELTLFMDLYMGLETDDYRTFLWAHFPPETIYAYFRKKARPGYLNSTMRDWFRSGGDFSGICRMLVTDPEGPQLLPEDFVKEVLTAGLHLENKFLYDPSDLDNRLRAEPDEIETFLMRFSAVFCGLRNSYIDYYLPLEEIQRICAETFGADHDIPAVFAAAEKACEEDEAEQMRRKLLEQIRTGGNENVEEVTVYNCNEIRDMFYWKEGVSVNPALDKMLRDAIRQVKAFHILSNPKWMEADSAERTRLLAQTLNWKIAVPVDLLDHVLANIMDDSFMEKYVALWSVNMNTSQASNFVQVMTMNQALFHYYWQSTDEQEPPEES